MPAAFSGYNVLGHALAGGNAPNAALMEAQGESLGANTENAIAEANARIARNKALADPALADKLTALAGGNPQLGTALHGLLQAGVVDPDKIMQAIGQNQKNAATATIANPSTTDEAAARANLARDPNTAGLIRPTAAGEAFTNVLHPDQGLQTSPLGQALIPAKVEDLNAKAALNRKIVKDPTLFHPNPMQGSTDPEFQMKLKYLMDNGYIDQAHVTRWNTNPGVVNAAYEQATNGQNFNPGGTAHESMAAAEKSFGPGGKNGERIRAGIALSSHFKALSDLADAQSASDMPAAQKAYTFLTGQAGSDFPSMNREASAFVGRELDGFLSAGNPTLQGHTDAQALVNPNDLGATQLHSNVALGKKLMGGQFAALKQTYASTPGRTADDVAGFNARFLGGNRDILDDWEKQNGEVKPQFARPARVVAPGAGASAPAPTSAIAAPAPGGAAPMSMDDYLKKQGF